MKTIRLNLILFILILTPLITNADIWSDFENSRPSEDPKVQYKIESYILDAQKDQYKDIEKKLLKILQSNKAEISIKQFVCRMLIKTGSENSIPVLSKLLIDKQLSNHARLVLQQMKLNPKIEQAFLSAMDKAPDNLMPGILAGISHHKIKKAIPKLSILTTLQSKDIATTALFALGQIGGNDSYQILKDMAVKESYRQNHMAALINCAESLDQKTASKLYISILNKKDNSIGGRMAALNQLLLYDEKSATTYIITIIKDEESELYKAALNCIAGTKSQKLGPAIIPVLKNLNPKRQTEVILALGNQKNKSILKSISKYIKADDDEVQKAAILAVGKLGDKTYTAYLLKIMKVSKFRDIALHSLVIMQGEGIRDELIKNLNKSDVTVHAINALIERGEQQAAPHIYALTENKNETIQRKAWEGIGKLGTIIEIEKTMNLLNKSKNKKQRSMAFKAVREAASRQNDKESVFKVIAKYFDQGDETIKSYILNISSYVGGEHPLKLVQKALNSKKRSIHDKAIRALAEWPDAKAAPILLEWAKKKNEDKINKIIALKGYIRVIGIERNQPSKNKKLKMYKEAIRLSTRVEEKKSIISGLQNVHEMESITMLENFLENELYNEEAETAILKITHHGLLKKHYQKVEPVLKKIYKDSKNEKRKKEAKSELRFIDEHFPNRKK
jgi:HEAT repeat protein